MQKITMMVIYKPIQILFDYNLYLSVLGFKKRLWFAVFLLKTLILRFSCIPLFDSDAFIPMLCWLFNPNYYFWKSLVIYIRMVFEYRKMGLVGLKKNNLVSFWVFGREITNSRPIFAPYFALTAHAKKLIR